MPKRQKWRDHALDYIRDTKRCPGLFPAFGHPDMVVTKEEFLTSVQSGGDHAWDACHYEDEILGLEPAQEVNLVTERKRSASGISKDSKTEFLRDNLTKFVKRIRSKPNGAIYIPRELLNLSEYVDDLFSDLEERQHEDGGSL